MISQAAQDYMFEQSLFQRIMKVNPTVVNLLSIQYRMHPDICQFPSEYFYDSKLENGPRMREACEASWHSDPMFPPYRFFDLLTSKEQMGHGGSLYNVDEAIFCAKMVKLLSLNHPKENLVSKIGGKKNCRSSLMVTNLP